MKTRIPLLMAVVLMAGVLVGCASLPEVAAKNRQKLPQLSVGMTKEEALKIMGTKTVILPSSYLQFQFFKIHNPYRNENIESQGRTFEVISYVTDVYDEGTMIFKENLTPLVFENGKLIGWGQNFLAGIAPKGQSKK